MLIYVNATLLKTRILFLTRLLFNILVELQKVEIIYSIDKKSKELTISFCKYDSSYEK